MAIGVVACSYADGSGTRRPARRFVNGKRTRSSAGWRWT
jgi:hypothetical protein